MQDHEMRGLLGDAYDETTDEQREQVEALCEALDARWPEPDMSTERTAALAAGLAVVLGDDTLEAAAQTYQEARAAAHEAHRGMVGAMMAEDAMGTAKTDIAARAGVSRETVHKALRPA